MNKFLLFSLILLTLCVYQGWSQSSSAPAQDTHLGSSSVHTPSNRAARDVPDKRIKKKKAKLPHVARAGSNDEKKGKGIKDSRKPPEEKGFFATITKIAKNIGFVFSNFFTGQYLEVFWNFYYMGKAILQFFHLAN